MRRTIQRWRAILFEEAFAIPLGLFSRPLEAPGSGPSSRHLMLQQMAVICECFDNLRVAGSQTDLMLGKGSHLFAPVRHVDCVV